MLQLISTGKFLDWDRLAAIARFSKNLKLASDMTLCILKYCGEFDSMLANPVHLELGFGFGLELALGLVLALAHSFSLALCRIGGTAVLTVLLMGLLMVMLLSWLAINSGLELNNQDWNVKIDGKMGSSIEDGDINHDCLMNIGKDDNEDFIVCLSRVKSIYACNHVTPGNRCPCIHSEVKYEYLL
jgi:hypothetical protein